MPALPLSDLWPAGARPAALASFGENLERDTVALYGFDLEKKLRLAAPALIEIEGVGLLALQKITGRGAQILTPAGRSSVPLSSVLATALQHAAAPHQSAVNQLLDDCAVSESKRTAAAQVLLANRLQQQRLGSLTTLRLPPGSSFSAHARAVGLPARLSALFACHALEYVLWIISWTILGRAALSGRFDSAQVTAWAVALLAILPFRLSALWLQGSVAIAAGRIFRSRLLAGALRLHPDEAHREGAGRFLSRSIEAEQVEALALSGAVPAALAVIELLFTAAVLFFGVTPLAHLCLLLLTLAVLAASANAYYRARSRWTQARLAMTHDSIEVMNGHRTRLAQQPPEEWHLEEDASLAAYARLSRKMDDLSSVLTGLLPRTFLLAGIALLTPAISYAQTPPALAVSVGGLLLGYAALRRLTSGIAALSGAALSWRQVHALFAAAARKPEHASTAVQPAPPATAVLDASQLSFTYPGASEPILDSASLRIASGDSVLLEGGSGSGKSTLVSLLTGLRAPLGGTLQASGQSRATVSPEAWTRFIAAAPQYHNNHVLTGPFAYNLLLGRMWPAGPSDFREADQLCRELGLGPLLDRMPGGLMQMVGETGWQLSQGERSRLFLARALLQNAPLIVLDESFAALDPETLRLSLECALRRARSLIVVAHV